MCGVSDVSRAVPLPVEEWKEDLLPKILSYVDIYEYSRIALISKCVRGVLENKSNILLASENESGQSNLFRVLTEATWKLPDFQFDRFNFESQSSRLDDVVANDSYLIVKDIKLNFFACLGPTDITVKYNENINLNYLVKVGDYLVFTDHILDLSNGKNTRVSDEVSIKLKNITKTSLETRAIAISKNQFIFYNNKSETHNNMILVLYEIKEGQCLIVASNEFDVLQLLKETGTTKTWDLDSRVGFYNNQVFMLFEIKSKNIFTFYICEIKFNKKSAEFTSIYKSESRDLCFKATSTGNVYVKEYEVWHKIVSKGEIVSAPEKIAWKGRVHNKMFIHTEKKDIYSLYDIEGGKIVCSKVKKDYIPNLLCVKGFVLYYLEQKKGDTGTFICSVFLPNQKILGKYRSDQDLLDVEFRCQSLVENGKIFDFYVPKYKESQLTRLRIKFPNEK